jgi:hypothetical protein
MDDQDSVGQVHQLLTWLRLNATFSVVEDADGFVLEAEHGPRAIGPRRP